MTTGFQVREGCYDLEDAIMQKKLCFKNKLPVVLRAYIIGFLF